MRFSIKGKQPNRTYSVDGREVSEDEFWAAAPKPFESDGPVSLVGFKPVHSDAMAVHPKQVKAAIAEDKKRGVPVEYDPQGRPVYTSSRQFRQHVQAYGNRHKGYA